jgi:hypothetical protein
VNLKIVFSEDTVSEKSKDLRLRAAKELRASRNGGMSAEKRDNRKRASAFKALADNQEWLDGESNNPTTASPRMVYDLAAEIRDEIEKIEREIAAQRQAAVNRVIDNLSCEGVETELRTLETRLNTLHANLRKAEDGGR